MDKKKPVASEQPGQKITDIGQALKSLEVEMKTYQERRQEELDAFMRKTGGQAFIEETNRNLSYLQGKIDALKALMEDNDAENK